MLIIERKILNKAKKLSTEHIQSTELNLNKYTNEQIYAAFLDLEKQGYMSNVGTSMDMSHTYGTLTINGMFYNEYRRNEISSLIFKSVFLPVVVSFIVNIIISLL